MKRAIVFLFAVVLCACATEPPTQKGFIVSMQKWVGRPVDELVASRGAPDNVFLRDSGRRVVEYTMTVPLTPEEQAVLGSHVRRSDGEFIPVPDTRQLSHDRAGDLRKYVLGAGRSCMVAFEVSADSIIQSWKIEEGSC